MALSRTVLERAALLVDRSGLAPALEEKLAGTRADGDPELRGRPRVLSVRTLLVGIALAAIADRELHLVRVRKILSALTWKQRQSLRIALGEGARLPSLTDRQVSYLWCRIVSLVDPSPHFSAAAAAQAERSSATPGGAGFDPDRLDLLQGMLDAIVEASLLDDHIPGRRTGAYAVDWTYAESWARKRRAGTPSPDPDASYIYIEKQSGSGAKYFLYGYKLHALIRTRTEGGDRVPYLAERITLTPASADPQTQVLGVIEDLAAEDRINMLTADRGYTMATADRWADPLRSLGVDLVLDLHPNQRSVKGTHRGALQIDGGLYCPAMPENLREITRLDEFAGREERESFFAEVERRRTWEMKPLGKEQPGKPLRYRCPAAAGIVRCPLKPDSLNLPYHLPTAYPDAGLQAAPPPCCTQTTISVPVEIQAPTRQKRTWGSREWFDAYARLRPAVESFFSLIKDPGKEHMARGRIKMMGLARTSIMVAFWTAAANLRLIDAFNREEDRQKKAAANGGLVVSGRKPRRHRAVSLTYRGTPGSPSPPKTPAPAPTTV